MILDGTAFSEHWPDLLVAASIASLGWIVRRGITAMDARHKRAEDKFSEIDRTINDHRIDIAEHNVRIKFLEKTARED